MLRFFCLMGTILGSLLTVVTLATAIFTQKPMDIVFFVICLGLLMTSVYGLTQTIPLGKILPKRESMNRVKISLNQLGRKNLWAPLALSATFVIIYFALYLSAKISLFPTEGELYSLGAAFGRSTAHGEAWRALTSQFLHGSILHLLCNAVGVLLMGRLMSFLMGWKNFLSLFLLGGVASTLASNLVRPDALFVGASGAIFALYGAMAVSSMLSPRMKKIKLSLEFALGSFLPLIGTFTYEFTHAGVDYVAAATGFLTGVVLSVAWFSFDKDAVLRQMVVGVSAMSMAAFAFVVMPKMVTPNMMNPFVVEQAQKDAGIAIDILQTLELSFWARLESTQTQAQKSKWVRESFLPMMESAITQMDTARNNAALNWKIKKMGDVFVSTASGCLKLYQWTAESSRHPASDQEFAEQGKLYGAACNKALTVRNQKAQQVMAQK